MANFCPTCKGLLRPRRGVLECITCSQRARARTVLTKGRTIHLQEGQSALTDRRDEVKATTGVEPPLAPKKSTWRPTSSDGEPHPQLDLFPYDTIRSGQKRFARDVTLAVQGRRHLVAQAPTGIGKTAAVLAPALRAALDQGKKVLFLTSRQSQHRIAVDTLRTIAERRGARFMMVDLVGKRDMCLRQEAVGLHPARFADFCAMETRTKSCRYLGTVGRDVLEQVHQGVLHVDELMQVSKDAQLCPHLVAMEAAQHAHVVVADYNHLFSDIRERSLERLGIRLEDVIVVVDEAHNLPDRIRKSHSHRIHDLLLDRVEEEAKRQRLRGLVADVEALRRALRSLADGAEKDGRAQETRLGDGRTRVARVETDELHTAFEAARNRASLGLHRTLQDTLEDLAPLVRKLKQGTDAQVHAETLQKALEDWGRFREGGLRFLEWEDDAVRLHVRLLDPGVPAKQVFDRVHCAVLMSGTLHPPEMARDLLGLEEQRSLVRTYVSPFPPEHRLVCVARGVTTRYRARGEALWQRMARIVEGICASTKGNVAVYAPSYAILRDVKLALASRDVAQEPIEETPEMGKAERDRVVDTLRGAKRRSGALLLGVLGGSFSEGVDFRDQLLDAVVVLGLPLAPPDLEVEATIEHFERQFPRKGRLYGYTYPAMNKVLQAMGRGIRSESDRCAVVLLDERYLASPYRGCLPPDLVASDDPAFTAGSFLAAHGLGS